MQAVVPGTLNTGRLTISSSLPFSLAAVLHLHISPLRGVSSCGSLLLDKHPLGVYCNLPFFFSLSLVSAPDTSFSYVCRRREEAMPLPSLFSVSFGWCVRSLGCREEDSR